jgi:hypothetical protein
MGESSCTRRPNNSSGSLGGYGSTVCLSRRAGVLVGPPVLFLPLFTQPRRSLVFSEAQAVGSTHLPV